MIDTCHFGGSVLLLQITHMLHSIVFLLVLFKVLNTRIIRHNRIINANRCIAWGALVVYVVVLGLLVVKGFYFYGFVVGVHLLPLPTIPLIKMTFLHTHLLLPIILFPIQITIITLALNEWDAGDGDAVTWPNHALWGWWAACHGAYATRLLLLLHLHLL